MTLTLLFCTFLLLITEISTREYLNIDRIPSWKAKNDPNIGPAFGQPEQIHLAYGGDPSSYSVTWLTYDDTLKSIVEYGTDIGDLKWSTEGRCAVFLDGQKHNEWRYVHRANLTGLTPGIRYCKRYFSVLKSPKSLELEAQKA